MRSDAYASPGRVLAAAALALGTLAACRSSRVESAPAPAAVGRSVHAGVAAAGSDSTRRGYTAADVRFLHHMLAHHQQALDMSALVPSRSSRDDMRDLAERITITQHGEMANMRRWLEGHGEQVPGAEMIEQHHGASASVSTTHMVMPGMLTREEMERLAAARGSDFDRLFLESMIRHHEGALTMVTQLFATPGAGQQSDLFRMANDVDADQRAEIARMRRMLNSMR